MSERSVLPTAAVAALVSAFAGEASAAGPMVRLPDAGHPFLVSTPAARVGPEGSSDEGRAALATVGLATAG